MSGVALFVAALVALVALLAASEPPRQHQHQHGAATGEAAELECGTAAAGQCGGGAGGAPQLVLSNGVRMPQCGFGTAGMRGDETRSNVRAALRAGFRHFDGAQATEWYDDAALGAELRAALGAGVVRREELFVTSKVHPSRLGDAYAAVLEMLATLGLEQLDLVLLHFESCWDGLAGCEGKSATWREAWPQLERLYDEGKVRAIGLSNAEARSVVEAMEQVRVKPHVVQNWMDPFHPDGEVRSLCALYGIRYTAYSSLGGQWEYRGERVNLVRQSALLRQVAKRHGVGWAEVALRWAMQHGVAVLPRSSSPAHTAANARLLAGGADMLTPAELRAIDGLARE
jgi:diketogulonate reductase-like aldo/keto reductase